MHSTLEFQIMTPLEREQMDLLRRALESRLPMAAAELWLVRRNALRQNS